MRTRIALVLGVLLFIVTAPASAQVGITAGGIWSDASVKVDGSDVSTESRTGFQVGLTYATGSVLGVVFGGYYSEKGFDLTDTSNRIRLSYVEVPVMAVVRLPVIGRVIGPRLYGGINGGYEVNCKTEPSGIGGDTFCDETNKFDFGLRGGLGVQILMVGLDFSYTYGLTDVASESNVEVKNRAWSLALLVGVG